MNSSVKPNYYEILSISPNATSADIVKAYRDTRLIFQPDSLAAYSLYTEEELEDILAQIEEAYWVLSDNQKRRKYDQKHGFVSATKTKPQTSSSPEPTIFTKKVVQPVDVPAKVNGSSLKAVRKSQGISIDEVADSTKISKAYLRAIEADNLSELPAPIYLKSYLKQYAAAIGLDAERVLEAYQDRLG